MKSQRRSSSGVRENGKKKQHTSNVASRKETGWFRYLVKKTEITHGIGVLLLLLIGSSRGGGRGGTTSSGSGGGSRGRAGILVGVLDPVLDVLDALPAELGLDGNGEKVLVTSHERVHDGREGRVADRKGDASDGGDARRELLEELGLFDVENLGGVDLAVVVDLVDDETVGERRPVQDVKEGSLGGTDLVTLDDDGDIVGDFDGTTGNLGRNTKGLEERRLTGLHTGVVSLDDDIVGSDGTGTSRSSNTVADDLLADLLEVGVGENETDVLLDEGKNGLILGVVRDETLESTADLESKSSVRIALSLSFDFDICVKCVP